MTQFKNMRRFTEVIIWLIITEFHEFSRAVNWLLSIRESERTKYTNAYFCSLCHIQWRLQFCHVHSRISLAMLSLLRKFHNFTNHLLYTVCQTSYENKRGRFQRCSYYRGSKSMKVGIFQIFETKRTTHKKSRVVHIREFFTRRVLTLFFLFISLSRSK